MLKFCIILTEKLYVCLIYFFIFMKKEYLQAAEVINSFYDVQSTFQPGQKYQYFMVYDDDITAVLRSAHIYKALKRNNPQMKFVAVGGEGLLAVAFKVMRFGLFVRGNSFALKRLKKETEAQRLKRIALRLGIDEQDIIVSDEGHNTTENLRAMSKIANGQKSLVVSTQRLAMVFKQSAEFQCNLHPNVFGCLPFDYDLLVIHQSVEETLRWYNFQTAGNGAVAFHLYASLVRRFEVYDGLFLKKPDLELTDVVRRADDLLRPKFLIKQRLSGFKAVVSYLQYIPIVWDIFMHSVDYMIDENNAIETALKMQ